MRANTLSIGTRALRGAVTTVLATVLGGTLFSNPVAAKDREVNIALHVSTMGFDLGRPADARKIYTRIEQAAWKACNTGVRVAGGSNAGNPRARADGRPVTE
jgi:UrcA family protein